MKNTGAYDGAEIVQLYVSMPGKEVFSPVRELKGFARVELKAGESKEVTIPLDDKHSATGMCGQTDGKRRAAPM